MLIGLSITMPWAKISSINFYSSQWLTQQLDGPNLVLSLTTPQKLLPSDSTNIGFLISHDQEKLFMTMALNLLDTTFKNFLKAMASKDWPQWSKTFKQILSSREYMVLWEISIAVLNWQLKTGRKILTTLSQLTPFWFMLKWQWTFLMCNLS